MTSQEIWEEHRLLVQSRDKILQYGSLWGLAENPEIILIFVTFNLSSVSGGLIIFQRVLLSCKGHQTVAFSLLSSFFHVSGKWGQIS